MRALAAIALLVTGCGEQLVVRSPPWQEGAQLAVIVLDATNRPAEALPRLLRAGGKIEVTIPAGVTQDLVIYEYDRNQKAVDELTPLIDCGATYEDHGGGLYPEPVRQYRTGLVGDDDADTLDLYRSNDASIPLYQIRCNLEPCALLDTDDVSIPITAPLQTVVGIADRDAVVGSMGQGGEVVLHRVINRTWDTIRPSRRIGGNPIDMVYDGQGTIYGTTAPDGPQGNLYAIHLDGQVQPAPLLSLGDGSVEIARGTDGSIFAGGDEGLYEIVAGSTVARKVEALPTSVGSLGVARRDRMLVADPNRVLWFYDGTGWKQEYAPLVTERFLDVAIDEEQAVAVGVAGIILRRDEGSGSWVRLLGPPQADGVTLVAVAVLAKGRFVVSFEPGGLAIWNGKAWCETLEPLGTAQIVQLATSPSRNQAFGVSTTQPVIGPKLQIVEVSPE